MDDYDVYEAALMAIGVGAYTAYLLIVLVIAILSLVALWKIYKKGGKPGWAALVPFYNQYCMFDIAFGCGWLFLLTFVPLVNIVIGIMKQFKLARAFGKGVGFGFGLMFLNTIFLYILAFGKAEYVGQQ